VVGNNVGSGARPSLHYAEKDAAKVASVLTELCHFAPNDVAVLAGRNLADLRRELDEVKRSIFAFKEHHGSSRVLLAFYFSGHSDGASLELGSDRFPFSDLRESLHATGADVRLAVLDACHSGAAIGTKGGKRAEGFDLTALRGDWSTITPQIHDGGDAKFFQFGQTLRGGLRAAEEDVANSSSAGHAGELQFLRRRAERHGGNRRLRGSVGNNLRVRIASDRGDEARGQKSFAQAGKKEPIHHGLDALVYSARWMKNGHKSESVVMEHDHYK